MKRFLGCILTIALVVLLFPQTAFAAKKSTDLSSQIQVIAEYNYQIYDFSNSRNYIVVVQNNSKYAARIEANGYGLDASGAIVEVQDDIIRSIAPGKQAVLDFWMENNENNEVAFTCQIKATKPAYEKDYSDAIVYSMNPTSNSAIVTVTNTGNQEADVTVQALFLNGTDIAYFNYDFVFEMSAGLTEAVQIDSGDRKFDNCLIYVQSSYFNF
ncbi:hypothetical protein [Pseudobutyrivibrio sp. MD2005]|uniref:hypothetical protein n=1 Tax=Pseudobutyrivibrio sp. MD2005 TaxID=1410616 RepID=UPI000482716C|nr:hypothetical protein [Pseudobutyrivibrio sp. MD2005]